LSEAIALHFHLRSAGNSLMFSEHFLGLSTRQTNVTKIAYVCYSPNVEFVTKFIKRTPANSAGESRTD
jgi:hypothetical protein